MCNDNADIFQGLLAVITTYGVKSAILNCWVSRLAILGICDATAS